ncbi:thioredoxin [Halobacteriales archaeon QS_9_67_15]|nr:MAG: thioredoxin [Halobacteriales archaeon QS_9_67_15]
MDERTIDARIDALVEEDVVDHDEETDELTTTDDFEEHRHIYYDTYLSMADPEFHEAVADEFGLPSPEAAAEHVSELEVTREEFATYLTISARLDGYDVEELTQMAGIAVEIGPKSPVPEAVQHLDDDSWPAFVGDNDRAVVTVWKRGCAPCDAMKEEIDEVLAGLPDGTAVGGLDGEECPEFCRDNEVNAAPAVAFFEDGECLDAVTGRTSPGSLAERAAELYDG